MGDPLTIEVRHEQDYVIVTAAGEIDISTVTRMRDCLFELAASGRPLVADLDQVSFIDSTGLAALVGTAKRAAACGGSLYAVCQPAEDPPAVPHYRAGPPDTASQHPGRGRGSPGGCPGHILNHHPQSPYRKSRKLLKETAASGLAVTGRDTWRQRQALVYAILALAAASAGDAHAWRRVLDPKPSPEPSGTRHRGATGFLMLLAGRPRLVKWVSTRSRSFLV